MAGKAAIGRVSGKARHRLVQLHRLCEFEAAFNSYLAGECSAAYVKARAVKMLAVGLPSFGHGKVR